jgi:hypothetical protein
MTRIAERFNVSGDYLAQVRTPLNVPRPEPGYWTSRLRSETDFRL